MKLLDLLEASPPFFCYYFARENGRHPGLEALSERSGLSQTTIIRLSQATSWKDITLGTLDRFCKALRIDFVEIKPSSGAMLGPRPYFNKPFKKILRRMVERNPKNPMPHLDANQKRRFAALCVKWKKERELPF